MPNVVKIFICFYRVSYHQTNWTAMKQPGFVLALVLPQVALTDERAANTMEPAAALQAIAIQAESPARVQMTEAVTKQLRALAVRRKASHSCGSPVCVAARLLLGRDQTHAAAFLRHSRCLAQFDSLCPQLLDESSQFQEQLSALRRW